MSSEIFGNSYKYIVDKSYGINRDGFIAIGTESVVYKGLKIKRDGGLQSSCVLKFKPKTALIGGKAVDRTEIFKNEEWKIFEELRECRSIVRVDDIVEDLGTFTLPCSHVNGGLINGASYFCVIEEFIDGWNLDEYCREQYWKLRRVEALGNGLSNLVSYESYREEERSSVDRSYHYDNILKFQNQILLFMINLCEIMEFVTGQKNILHLDIKPENIMVTKHGRELVLIDFGNARKVTKANRFATSDLIDADYREGETMENRYQFGAVGFAAPECFAKAASDSTPPFAHVHGQGSMSIESDLFSFGATFWECLNIFELVTKSKLFARIGHDFYENEFLQEDLYTNRDLSCTSIFYHKKLETIIKKCTRRRTATYTDLANHDYYHSYKDLKRDIENAKDSAPTIIKEEDVKVKNAFGFCGAMVALSLVFLIVFFAYRFSAFSIAEGKWDALTANYNETQFYRLEETANDLLDAAPPNSADGIYTQIARFTYSDGDISEYEAAMLVSLLRKVNNNSLLPQRVDEIMQKANTRKFKEISTEIVKLNVTGDSIGYNLARAIVNVEVGKTEIVAAYQTLMEYQDNTEFRSAVVKLKNVLDNDGTIAKIAQGTGQNRTEIQSFFAGIETKDTPR
ncbi:MAG: protein kinase [Coriobacteriales bacterium]|jgi:serine/threonine protein kinase|nr:protein kinase [Coriobacteriales bacterium]